jgi:F-type H+-transporting ATPase subunit delta
MAENNTIARPYAEAVFELAREAGALDAWSDALEVAGRLMADGRVAEFLGNPSLSDDERLRFVTGLVASAAGRQSLLDGSDRRGTNFLKLLIENDRVGVMPEIAEHFEGLKAETENVVDVTVTSAAPLDDAQRQAITTALRKRLGREIRLDTELDEDLIGGAVIRAGDVVIDGSLRARLDGLASALTA